MLPLICWCAVSLFFSELNNFVKYCNFNIVNGLGQYFPLIIFPRTLKWREDTGFVPYESTSYVCSPLVIALVPTFIDGFNITSYKRSYVGYDNISSNVEFHGPWLHVKVTVAIFRKTLSSF